MTGNKTRKVKEKYEGTQYSMELKLLACFKKF